MVVTPTANGIEIRRGRKSERRDGNVLRLLAELMAEHKPVRGIAALPPFTGGAVGFVAYDFVRRLERIPNTAKNDLRTPDLCLMFFDRVLAFDHVKQQIQLIASADVRDLKQAKSELQRAERDIATLERKLGRAVQAGRGRGSSAKAKVEGVTSKQDFLKSV